MAQRVHRRTIRTGPALRDDARPRRPHPRQLPVLLDHRAHRRGHREDRRRVQGSRRRDAGERVLPARAPRSSPRRGRHRHPRRRRRPSRSARSGSPTSSAPRRRSPTTSRSRCTCAASSTSARCAHAVRALPARHDALRSTFGADGADDPRRRRARARGAAARPRAGSRRRARDAALAAIARRHVSEPFDLEHGPLVRAELVRLDADHHVLVFTGHHIVLDGWSYWVIVQGPRVALRHRDRRAHRAAAAGAVVRRLRRRVRGARRCAPSTRAQRDVVGRAVRRRRARARAADRSPAPGRAHARPPVARTTCCRPSWSPACASSAPSSAPACSRRCSPGFDALLHRLTGHDRSRRRHPGGRPVGRGPRGPRRSLREHAAAAQPDRRASDTFAEHVTASRSDDARRVRSPGRHVRPRAADAADRARPEPAAADQRDLQHRSGADRRGPGLPGVALELRVEPAQPRDLRAVHQRRRHRRTGMRLECQYNTRPVRRRDRAALARGVRGAAASAPIADPNQAVGKLPSPAKRIAARSTCGTGPSSTIRARRASRQLIVATARRVPDAIAVRSRGKHAELRASSTQRAERASRRAARARRAAAATASACASSAMLDLLPASSASLEGGRGLRAARSRRSRASASLHGPRTRTVAADRHDERDRRGRRVRRSATSGGRARRRAARRPMRRACTTLPGRPTDTAYVIYTSGSTGKPKGVRGAAPRGRQLPGQHARASPASTRRDRLLAVTTLSFDIAVLELLLPLTVGARVVLAHARQADGRRARCARCSSATGVTRDAGHAATWRLLLEARLARRRRRSRRCAAARPLPRDLAAGAAATRVGELWNMYGPTETTVWSTRLARRAPDARGMLDRPADREHQRLRARRRIASRCPVGVPGELCIGGDGVTLRLPDRPELTAERFVPDPFAAIRARACTAPATSAAGAPTARSSTWAASTSRSRCAAIASSSARSRRALAQPPGGARRPWSSRARTARATCAWSAYVVARAGSAVRRRRLARAPARPRCPTTWCRSTSSSLERMPLTAQRQDRPQGAAGAAEPRSRDRGDARRAAQRRREEPSRAHHGAGARAAAASASTTTSSRSAATRCSPRS